MRVSRGRSQVLFGFLPDQTVDLYGRIWKVDQWLHTKRSDVDTSSLVRELRKLASAWDGNDSGYLENLFRGRTVVVQELTSGTTVKVEPFPNVWICSECKRYARNPASPCRCGASRWGQLPFVGYHECGSLREPYIPTCPTHRQVKIVLPGTASAAEILFQCPECNSVLRTGFGFPPCGCGSGRMQFTVHRAASVFTPRTVVVVNPPSRQQVERLNQAGGPQRALSWAVGGMSQHSATEAPMTAQGLRERLLADQLPPDVVDAMVKAAVDSGALAEHGDQPIQLPDAVLEQAEADAVTLAMGVATARTRLEDMVQSTEPFTERGELYRTAYPSALRRAGIEALELVDRFPVLSGSFGFTRGKSEPGSSTLKPYRDRAGNYIVYADSSETEAWLVRLDPERVGTWLRQRGHAIDPFTDARSARLSILRGCRVPERGEDVNTPTAGSDLLTLVHSFCHRLLRRAAVFAGIDRNGLSELLVPTHAAFFLFASSRGDFVLGGLQAVFETELENLLEDFVNAEHRCPLDPGCTRAGGACMACIHIGEPSCRFFNRHLSREVLSGSHGFLRQAVH